MNRLSDGRVLDNLKDFDLLNALKNKYLRQNSRSYPINRPKRTGLDSMTGISIGSAKKRRYYKNLFWNVCDLIL